MNVALQTNNLTKRYHRFQALDGLTMHVPEGSIYGLIGRNGAGKTTLIRLICGLQEPSSGSFELYGMRNDSNGIVNVRRRIGAIIEAPALYENMTAEQNLRQQYLILGLPSYDGISDLLNQAVEGRYDPTWQKLFLSSLAHCDADPFCGLYGNASNFNGLYSSAEPSDIPADEHVWGRDGGIRQHICRHRLQRRYYPK